MNKQLNVSIPQEWFEQLERLARLYSVEEDRTLTHLDLIRDAIKTKYNLTETGDNEETGAERKV